MIYDRGTGTMSTDLRGRKYSRLNGQQLHKQGTERNPTNQSPSHLQVVEVFCPTEPLHLSIPLSTHSTHSNIYSCEHMVTFSTDRSFELPDTGQSRLQGNIIIIIREEEVSSTIPQKSMEILSKVLK